MGTDGLTRLVVATADPGTTLPGKAAWYLATNLPRPGGPREAGSPHAAADLAEITRIYGIRHWTGQSYKQVMDELGWADFQVRSDIAIRRHQVLVTCVFSFCWAAWFGDHPAPSQGVAAGAGRLTLSGAGSGARHPGSLTSDRRRQRLRIVSDRTAQGTEVGIRRSFSGDAGYHSLALFSAPKSPADRL